LSEPIKLSWLKEEQNVLVTLNATQIERVLKGNPRSASGQRTHVLACMLLDTGLRITEAVSLTRRDVDLDNLLLKVRGKGQKERIVPMSFELRKLLFRWLAKLPAHYERVFPTRDGATLRSRLVLVNFKTLGKCAGIVGVRMSPHTLRHTFAVSYLRAGGNLFYLSKILGHTSITTTQRYLQSLGIEDLQAVHNRLSLLSRT
jgi:integrase/recombinase XerD